MKPEVPFPVPIAIDLDRIREEMAQIQTMTLVKQWEGEFVIELESFALVGYKEDPLYIESPETEYFVGAAPYKRSDPSMLVETRVAERFPACLAVAADIPGPNERVRVSRLKAGKVIAKHRDPHPKWEERYLVRFHVPIVYPELCVFIMWDRVGRVHEVCRPDGSVWFIDTNLPHMVVNGDSTDRYNLVIDKFLSDELRQWLEGQAWRHFLKT